MSSHRLEIEAGRWVKPNSIPVDDRKCAICLILEDEYHFVFECEIYKDLRSKYIAPYYWRRPNMFKFIELLNHTGQCKRTCGSYNELVVAFYSTGGGVKGKKSIPVDFIIYL